MLIKIKTKDGEHTVESSSITDVFVSLDDEGPLSARLYINPETQKIHVDSWLKTD